MCTRPAAILHTKYMIQHTPAIIGILLESVSDTIFYLHIHKSNHQTAIKIIIVSTV